MSDTKSGPTSVAADVRSDYLLFVEFQDGYAFRNMIEYLKAAGNKTGSFVFTQQGITYQMSNHKETVVNCVQILRQNLTCYIYNSTEPKLSIGLTLAMFRTNTKSIGKKDGVQLFMLPNDPNLYIRQLSATVKGTSENLGFIRPQHSDAFEFEIDGYTRGDDNPNCTIPTSDFSKMAANMCAAHCKSVIFKGLSKGLICQGMLQGGLLGRVTHFGICDSTTGNGEQNHKTPKLWIMRDDEIKPTVNIKVDDDIIKALAKINNMSGSSGIVKIFMEPDMPMLLVCNISNCGTLRIYLKDTSTEK